MKKLSLVLVLLMIVSMLAGCAVVERIYGLVEDVIANTEEVPAGVTETLPATEATEPATEATEPATEAVEETEPATEAAEENAVSMGRLVGGVYSNSYTGYACELNTNKIVGVSSNCCCRIADSIGALDFRCRGESCGKSRCKHNFLHFLFPFLGGRNKLRPSRFCSGAQRLEIQHRFFGSRAGFDLWRTTLTANVGISLAFPFSTLLRFP